MMELLSQIVVLVNFIALHYFRLVHEHHGVCHLSNMSSENTTDISDLRRLQLETVSKSENLLHILVRETLFYYLVTDDLVTM